VRAVALSSNATALEPFDCVQRDEATRARTRPVRRAMRVDAKWAVRAAPNLYDGRQSVASLSFDGSRSRTSEAFATRRCPYQMASPFWGANNSGKTSVLRILNWILNEADDSALMGDAQLTEDELRLLLPARETRNAARRLVLGVGILDGRRRSRFQCVGDTAHLRVSVTLPDNVRLNVGPPRRGETADWENALPLLEELRSEVSFSLVPASRDAQSRSFTTAFRSTVLAKLRERAVHSGRAGAPAEDRTVKHALDEIRAVADSLVLPIWADVKSALPPGMAESAEISTNLEPKTLVAWIADRTVLRITTGEHDKSHVEPDQVGSGLQSLLELALQQTREVGGDIERIIAVEEPEAFLHPSAQRTLPGWCRRLRLESASSRHTVQYLSRKQGLAKRVGSRPSFLSAGLFD
jgi:hypothetical protein